MSVLTNPKILVEISRNVSKILGGVTLTDDENIYISIEARNLDVSKFNKTSLQTLINVFSHVVAKEIKRRASNTTNNNDNTNNNSEKRQIYRNKKESYVVDTNLSTSAPNLNDIKSAIEKIDIITFYGIQDKYKLQLLLSPESLYESNYIVLDTTNATNFDNNVTKFNWEYMESALIAPGVVNTTAKIKDLVGMHLYPLKFAATRGYRPYPEITNLLIEEFSAQSFISHEGRKFHFVLQPTFTLLDPPNAYLEYSPYEYNKGYFWFRKPFTIIRSFTISLARGNTVIPLPTSNVDGAITNYPVMGYPESPIGPGYANPTVVWTFTAHNSQTGDTIIISKFTTLNPVGDAAIIAQVNDPNGHLITVLGANAFTIPVDTSVIASIDRINQAVISMTNPRIRTIIPIELISLKNTDENSN